MGIVPYVSIVAVVWTGTTYRQNHLSVLIAFSLLIALGILVRIFIISARERITAVSIELWYRLAAFTIFILSTSVGSLLAHAMVVDGLASWNFVLILIWNTGIISGSAVSFAANSKLLKLQLSGLLICPLFCALWLHTSASLQYTFANLVYFGFTLQKGKQISSDFWKQLAARFLEENRRREIDSARALAEEARHKAERGRQGSQRIPR